MSKEDEIKDGMRMDYGTTVYHYRGYDIRFNENSDLWGCHALNVEHAQLSVVKEMIGKIDAKARKLDGIPVLILEQHSSVSMTPAYAQLLDADQKGVWVTFMAQSGHGYHRRAVEKREKKSLASILADTPENREAIAALVERQKAHYAEGTAIRKAAEAMERWTPPKPQEVEAMPEEASVKLAARPIRTRTR